ncbi:hypothetical protein CI1B_43660 [Bradyrhizobium ivorense]|uniref:Uncharacterized protein n=1 Tax=Bradyrhizobium ivorense TaxID=2511166 RepID=A0A508TEG6_9BRAD|nr:hypothetical protein CI1B_43660 [Bradyrhizobium ivorense]
MRSMLLKELQALRLLRAFAKIEDPNNRNAVLEFVEAVAKSERGKRNEP